MNTIWVLGLSLLILGMASIGFWRFSILFGPVFTNIVHDLLGIPEGDEDE